MSTRKIITAERVPTSPAPQEKAVATAKKEKTLVIYNSVADIEAKLSGTEKLKAINLRIDAFVSNMQKIVVSDDVSAKALDTLISEAKNYIKELDNEGKAARDPYNVTAKSIKAFYDNLTGKLLDIAAAGQKKIVDYLAEEKRKQQKEAQLKEKQQLKLNAWIVDAIKAINNCFTKEEMSEVHTQYIKPFKVEDYPNLSDQVVAQALASVKEVGKARIDGIKSGEIKPAADPGGDPMDEEEETEQVGLSTEEAIEEVQAAMAQAQISTPVTATLTVKLNTSVRRTIAFKLWKGEAEVDIKFKSVDEKKVKAFIDMEREKIKKNLDAPGVTQGYVAGGILFYYEEGATTR